MAMPTKCISCGAFFTQSKYCPHCGAKKKAKGRALVVFLLLLLSVLLIIPIAVARNGAADAPPHTQNATQTINNAIAKGKLEESAPPEIALNEFGNKTICGSFKNVSGKTIAYVQITFALYDKDGAQIGTAAANINNLTSGSVWKYSAHPLTLEEWERFELTEISSF